jgi:basic membrane protein A
VAASVRKPADYTASCSAADRPMFFIGVDSNQNHIGDSDRNPATMNYGLTSMVKRVDVAVYNTIRDLVQGTPWRTGERHFALANDGVGFALDEYNRALLSPKLQRQVELVRKNIISGLIKVPKQ